MENKSNRPIIGVHPDLAKACSLLYQFGIIVLRVNNGFFPGDPEDAIMTARVDEYGLTISGPILKIGQPMDHLGFVIQSQELVIKKLKKILPSDWKLQELEEDERIHSSIPSQGLIYQLVYFPAGFDAFYHSWEEITEEILYEFAEMYVHDDREDAEDVFFEYLIGDEDEFVSNMNARIKDNLSMDKSEIDDLRSKGADLLCKALQKPIQELSEDRIKYSTDIILQLTEQAARLSVVNLHFHDIAREIDHLHEIIDYVDPTLYSTKNNDDDDS